MEKVELGDGVAAIPPDEWNALVGDDSPFLDLLADFACRQHLYEELFPGIRLIDFQN